MKINKRISVLLAVVLVAVAAVGMVPAAQAATPTLTLAKNSDGNSVQITVNGDPNASIIFYYSKTGVGPQTVFLGTTSASGYYSNSISPSDYAIVADSAVHVTVGGLNGPRSADVVWPAAAGSSSFYINPTGLVLSLTQTASITAYNIGSSSMYVSNNSNPPVANISVSGSQINVTAISYGATTATLCLVGNTSSCVSAYITVQNSGAQALTFGTNNVTVVPGQSVPISISGGNGSYSVLNNSNSAAVQSSISGSTITLTTNSTSGSAAITVCSSDMNSCGIINATASSVSTSPLVFSQTNPNISIGQSLTIGLSGGSSSTYYVSSNSNTSVVSTSISGSSLMLNGLATGSATVSVCSSSGSCGSLAVSVSYTSSGGALALSQTNVSLLVGQVLSVTVSGGTSPYNLGSNNGSVFQSSLNGNIITISGIASGYSTLSVCSSGGACLPLTITVNSSGTSMPITLSRNNITLGVGGAGALTITGSGGYFVSNSSNSAVASVQINGNAAVVSALSVGNTNISICQSGGQCAMLLVSVSASTGASNPAFSQTNPMVGVGQVQTLTISGGGGTSYYISANSNPSAASFSINGSNLTISGLAAGSTSAVICATANSCAALTVSVTGSSVPAVVLSPASGTLLAGTSMTVALSGNSGYYISNNTNLTVATAQISGNTLTVNALAAGSSNISVCQTGGQCATFPLTVNAAVVSTPTSSPVSSFSSGQLIKDNGTIYMVYKNTKSGFANAAAFLGLGFNFKNVAAADNSGLALSGRIVVTAAGAHPRGTWVLSGKAVYMVTPEGLIPVPTWDTFLGNGGQASFLVKANSYDLRMAKLPAMALNDARLK